MFSGCRISFDEFRIGGRVTDADGWKGISPATIHYQKNYGSWRQTQTDSMGYWSIWAGENDRLTIWVEKENFMFQPAPYRLTVTGNRSDINFKLIGWSDDFSTKSGKWYEGMLSDIPGDNSEAKYLIDDDPENQMYQMYIHNSFSATDGSAKSMAPFTIPSNYTVKVTGISDYGFGMYGLLFNVTSLEPGYSYYVFRVDSLAGEYEVVKMKIGNDGIVPEYEIPRKFASIISTGPDVANILEVRQNWKKVELLVNNEKIDGFTIDEWVNDSIQVGLHAHAYSDQNHYVLFDDFHVTANGIGPQMPMTNMIMSGTISIKDIELK